MQLGQEKQDELKLFLNDSCIKFADTKQLTSKKAELISEYTKYIQNRITGKTV